ncbi:MAG: hypothetical protein R2681_18675 [Pyrinomonadaceae bacterium]
MEDRETVNNEDSEAAHNSEVAPAENESPKTTGSELSQKIWSVVTFDGLAASGITYQEALEKMAVLTGENVSGLCIVTDEAAARISK